MPQTTHIRPMDESLSLLQLMQAFEALTQQTNPLERLPVEAEKLRLIQAFEALILNAVHLYTPPLQNSEQGWLEALKQHGRDMLYYFLLWLGMIQNAATGYLFWLDLFSLMPTLSNPMVVFLSICCMIFGSGLFYSFEVTFLQDALGITGSNTELSRLLDLYSEQLHATSAIHQWLTSMHMWSVEPEQYDGYLRLTTLINQDLQIKQAKMGHYPESLLKQMLKAMALTFGAFSTIAGSYVATNTLLTTFASCWVGTPLGWALILTAMIVDLGFYYAMGATSTAQLINPDFDHYQTLKKEFESFQTTFPGELHAMKGIRHRFFERKPMQDASTQTSESLNVIIH